MKLGLINSAWSQSGKGVEYGIEQTKRIGFDAIDIQADPLDLSAGERRLIRQSADRNGLPVMATPLPCGRPSAGLQPFHERVTSDPTQHGKERPRQGERSQSTMRVSRRAARSSSRWVWARLRSCHSLPSAATAASASARMVARVSASWVRAAAPSTHSRCSW